MKNLILALVFMPLVSMAQNVDVKNVDSEGEGTTTIEIKKSKNSDSAIKSNSGPQWKIEEGTADIEGETGALVTDAKKSWKAACDEWEKKFRKENSDVISTNCGRATCSGDVGSKVCSSEAKYKIKTRVN